jgi:hypothetical protein
MEPSTRISCACGLAWRRPFSSARATVRIARVAVMGAHWYVASAGGHEELAAKKLPPSWSRSRLTRFPCSSSERPPPGAPHLPATGSRMRMDRNYCRPDPRQFAGVMPAFTLRNQAIRRQAKCHAAIRGALSCWRCVPERFCGSAVRARPSYHAPYQSLERLSLCGEADDMVWRRW